MAIKKIKDISGCEYSVTAISLVEIMGSCDEIRKLVDNIELPDGRIAQVQILITTDNCDFFEEEQLCPTCNRPADHDQLLRSDSGEFYCDNCIDSAPKEGDYL